MKVRVVNDICVKIVDDPEHDQLWKNHFLLMPNSVRHDLPFEVTLRMFEKPRPKVWTGKDMVG